MKEEEIIKAPSKNALSTGLVIRTPYFSILRPILIQHVPILSILFKKH